MLTWKQGASIYYQQAVEDRRYTVAKYADLVNGGWHYVAWFKDGSHLERLNDARNDDVNVARQAASDHFGALRKAA